MKSFGGLFSLMCLANDFLTSCFMCVCVSLSHCVTLPLCYVSVFMCGSVCMRACVWLKVCNFASFILCPIISFPFCVSLSCDWLPAECDPCIDQVNGVCLCVCVCIPYECVYVCCWHLSLCSVLPGRCLCGIFFFFPLAIPPPTPSLARPERHSFTGSLARLKWLPLNSP